LSLYLVSLESVRLSVRLSGSSSLGADAGITGFSLSSRRSGSHQLRPSWAGCLGGCEVRRPSRHPNRPHRQLVWPDDADRPRMLNSRPELPIPNAAAQTRIVSVARIRLDSWKSVRPFKEIFCDDISEFESYMPSHAVGSLWGAAGFLDSASPGMSRAVLGPKLSSMRRAASGCREWRRRPYRSGVRRFD